MKKISYSQLVSYIQCPYKWNLIYQLKIQERIYKIQSIFGTSFHQTLQTFLYNYYNLSIKQSKKIDYQSLLKENIITNYKKDLERNNNKDFVSLQQLMQIYEDGRLMLAQFLKKCSKYFKKRGLSLIGTQIQINYKLPEYQDIYFTGLIDVLLFDTKINKYTIVDIKTSKYKWDDKKKNDFTKRLQLILYKYFYSQEKQINLQNIDVQFLIFKRKVFESAYTISRIQRIVPPNSQKTCLSYYKHVLQILNQMNTDIQKNQFIKKPSQSNCRFCPACDAPHLCDKKNK